MIFFVGVIIIIICLIILAIWYRPELLLYPLNYTLRLDSSVRRNFYSPAELDNIFPAHQELETAWEIIRDEGYALYDALPNKDINYLEYYHMDLGKENKQHWTTIPLRLFGHDATYDITKCPYLYCLLRQHPEIKSCLFSIMQAGKIIEPHYGPYDGLIRYQLALDIPTCEKEEECYLHVASERYQWKNGESVLFDESNLHGAVNTTSKRRMVLLIDVKRPYDFVLWRWLNSIVVMGMGALPATKSAVLL